MTGFRADLAHAVAALDRHYAEMKEAARHRLGSLYNDADYPETLVGLFGLAWDFPALGPPDYLVAALAGRVRAGAARRGGGAVRGGGAQQAEAGLRRRVRPPGRAPGRAAQWGRRRRLALGLPRLGGGQPPRVLRAVPRAKRALEPRARRAGGTGAARGPRRHAAGTSRRGGGARERVAAGLIAGPRVARLAPGRPAAAPRPPPIDGGCVMELVVDVSGRISCIYDEVIDLAALGECTIRQGQPRRA